MQNELFIIVLSTWLAGMASFVGGFVAWLEGSAETELKQESIHGIVAFGGGILIAAVAFALTPPGIQRLDTFSLTASFAGGAGCFCIIDAWLSRTGGSKAQFMAMLMDFIPEAISLGAVFAHDRKLGFLLAAFIGAQNLPEGFNAYREVTGSKGKPGKTLAVLLACSLFGPVAGCAGYFLLQNKPDLTAAIMTFAAGGIMYLIFQDIAPQASMKRHWTPPLGAAAGFLIGMLGQKFLG